MLIIVRLIKYRLIHLTVLIYTFFSFRVQLYIERVTKEVQSKRPMPLSSTDSSGSSFFASTFFSSAGAAVIEEEGSLAGAAQPAGPPAPTFPLRHSMLTLTRAFANKPGQRGSTLQQLL